VSGSGSASGSRPDLSGSGSASGSRPDLSGGVPLVVAIDGPAGSGKSTVAAALARALDVPHVDTGAYYRAATLAVLRSGVDLADGAACAAVVAAARIGREDGRTRLDGDDVEDEIRGAAVTAAVSSVSGHPEVRAALLAVQRAGLGERGGVVEGRDAGTVVVPDASLKVWLTASPLERAARRAAQLGERDPEAVALHAADLERRDQADAAQMVRAADVVEVDSTGRTVESVVAELVHLALALGGGAIPGPAAHPEEHP
jgi:cytidylate kinase